MKTADSETNSPRLGRRHARILVETLERICQDEEIFITLTDERERVYELAWARDRRLGLARWSFGLLGETTMYTSEQLPIALLLSPLDEGELLHVLQNAVFEQVAVAELALDDAKAVLAQSASERKLDSSGRPAGAQLSHSSWLCP